MTDADLASFKDLCTKTGAKLLEYKKNSSFWVWFKALLITREWRHRRAAEAQDIAYKINSLANSSAIDDDLIEKQNALILLLNEKRYGLSTLTKSNLFREKIQEALQDVLLTCLDIAKRDVPRDYLKKMEQLHHDYQTPFYTGGDFFITGLLLEWFGIQYMLQRALNIIKMDLQTLLLGEIEEGFLTKDSINEYLEKIDIMLATSTNNELPVDDQIKHARYLLEDIQNAAGVIPPYEPKYSHHAPLIKSCFWHDEMFKLAQSKLAAQESMYQSE